MEEERGVPILIFVIFMMNHCIRKNVGKKSLVRYIRTNNIVIKIL